MKVYVVKKGDLYSDGCGNFVSSQSDAYKFTHGADGVYKTAKEWAFGHAAVYKARVVRLVPRKHENPTV